MDTSELDATARHIAFITAIRDAAGIGAGVSIADIPAAISARLASEREAGREETAKNANVNAMTGLPSLIDHAFETVAKWHDKNAGLCLSASEDDPRLNADDRSRAYDAHRHHAASAAAIRLKLTDEKRALLRAIQSKDKAE